jgi:hypothetical protein
MEIKEESLYDDDEPIQDLDDGYTDEAAWLGGGDVGEGEQEPSAMLGLCISLALVALVVYFYLRQVGYRCVAHVWAHRCCSLRLSPRAVRKSTLPRVLLFSARPCALTFKYQFCFFFLLCFASFFFRLCAPCDTTWTGR